MRQKKYEEYEEATKKEKEETKKREEDTKTRETALSAKKDEELHELDNIKKSTEQMAELLRANKEAEAEALKKQMVDSQLKIQQLHDETKRIQEEMAREREREKVQLEERLKIAEEEAKREREKERADEELKRRDLEIERLQNAIDQRNPQPDTHSQADEIRRIGNRQRQSELAQRQCEMPCVTLARGQSHIYNRQGMMENSFNELFGDTPAMRALPAPAPALGYYMQQPVPLYRPMGEFISLSLSLSLFVFFIPMYVYLIVLPCVVTWNTF